MECNDTDIAGVKLLRPARFGDQRGSFMETYSRRKFEACGIDATFVQDNLVHSRHAGTMRGLHFQKPPHAQAKLISVLVGAVFDVAVDIRVGSPTYGKAVGVRLDAESGRMLYIPIGFAHGYCTLVPDSLVAYKVTDFYAPETEGGLFWRDPALGIEWPVGEEASHVVDRDRALPPLAQLQSPFTFTLR